VSLSELVESYVLRKRWEMDLLALSIMKRLAEALGAGDSGKTAGRISEADNERVSADTWLRMMGIEL